MLLTAVQFGFKTFKVWNHNLAAIHPDQFFGLGPDFRDSESTWPADDPEPFFHQGVSYKVALDACGRRRKERLCAYATYTGFNYTDELSQNAGMGKRPGTSGATGLSAR